jgi:dihydropteroate synthase
MIWRFRGGEIDLTRRGVILGIVNVTPDSFSDGGRACDPEAARRQGLRLLEEGADILDIGGESTRPGSLPVSLEEELRRVIPVIRALRAVTDAPISVDTSKAAVAEAALAAGADIINDVTALSDPGMGPVAGASGSGLILMHMQGSPHTMQENPSYKDDDVVADVSKFLSERRAAAIACGVHADAIILDPGLGFGKTLSHNLALLRGIPALLGLGSPILIGHSRKSFLGSIAGETSGPDFAGRLLPAIAITAMAFAAGARLFRVHDPAPHRVALRTAESVSRGEVRP